MIDLRQSKNPDADKVLFTAECEKLVYFDDLDEMHKVLHQFKIDHPDKRGVANFNDMLFFTDDENLSIDFIYKTVLGKTRAEYKKACAKEQQALFERETQERNYKCSRISSLIRSGLSILPGEHWDEWIDCVPYRVNDIYNGWDLEMFLEFYQAHKTETFEALKNRFNKQGHSGMSASITLAMIKKFIPNGREIADYITNTKTPNTAKDSPTQ